MSASVENLATVWSSIDQLCSGLPDAQWDLPTGCPGWTVKDHLSHLVDYESRALGRPGPEHEPGPLPHVKNEMGQANEIGVDARRPRPGAQVLAEFREVTGERLARLRTLTGPDLAAPVATPAGPGTMADLVTLRVMDSWMHEQDIRRATGRPGHADGPAAAEAVGYFTRFLPYVVGKRAAAPDGSKVVFRVGGRDPVAVQVAGGRGSLAADAAGATAVLVIPVTTFAALAGGRSDAPDDARITGDEPLGRRVLGSMGLMP
ncbi:MAG TPA: maleylpyruvate isomerase family mycothiol-dependent enzyme [Streptosporangiaceae bacterium]|nr:maleylpyruvate isomerase family mycothiol-dependent enzyme [Streptosporangiaceae bacterium]